MGTYPIVTIYGNPTEDLNAGFWLDKSTPPRVTAMPTIIPIKTPARQGSFWTNQGRYDNPLFTVVLEVDPWGLGDFDQRVDLVDAAIDYWAAICRVPVIPIIYQRSASVTRYTDTRISSFSVERDGLPDSCRITMVFELVLPFWWGSSSTVLNTALNFTAAVSGADVGTVYRGSAPIVDAQFVITGPIASGVTVFSTRREDSLQYVKYTGAALTSTQAWRFDALAQNSYVGTAASMSSVSGGTLDNSVHTAPSGRLELWPVSIQGSSPPWPVQYSISAVSGASATTSIRWKARSAWL